MTRERPIIMSAESVRALLDGTKRQTRRVVKPQPGWIESSGRWYWDAPRRGLRVYTASREWHEDLSDDAKPYAPRDTLWVREAWRPEELPSGLDGIRYRADAAFRPIEDSAEAADAWGAVYPPRGCVWRASIHMPRWASRLTLEVESITVERLQDITEEDAVAEGVNAPRCPRCGYTRYDCQFHLDHDRCSEVNPDSAIPMFAELWDSINGKRPGCAWADSPWVWRIAFRRAKP